MQKVKFGTVVKNCHFQSGNVVVKFDGPAMIAVEHISQALLNLTEIIKSQHIEIGGLLTIEGAK